jgi:hypothetical protein
MKQACNEYPQVLNINFIFWDYAFANLEKIAKTERYLT